MNRGNWVPIDKTCVKALPKDRPYTQLEAAFSMQVDYDKGNSVTVAGYADLWMWSRRRVRTFMERVGATIRHSRNTNRFRNQTGHIVIHKPDINRTKNGHIRLIDNKGLSDETDKNRTYNGNKADIKRSTTRKTNTKTNKNTKKNRHQRQNCVDADTISDDPNDVFLSDWK